MSGAMSSPLRKNNLVSENQKLWSNLRVPRSQEGASRSSRTSSAGCDGRGRAARRAARSRTVKPCGPGTPMLVLSKWRMIHLRRWQKSPVHRGEHGVSRKAIAQGVPDRFGQPVVTMLVCFFVFANEAAGAASARHSLRPPFHEGHGFSQSSGAICAAAIIPQATASPCKK